MTLVTRSEVSPREFNQVSFEVINMSNETIQETGTSTHSRNLVVNICLTNSVDNRNLTVPICDQDKVQIKIYQLHWQTQLSQKRWRILWVATVLWKKIAE